MGLCLRLLPNKSSNMLIGIRARSTLRYSQPPEWKNCLSERYTRLESPAKVIHLMWGYHFGIASQILHQNRAMLHKNCRRTCKKRSLHLRAKFCPRRARLRFVRCKSDRGLNEASPSCWSIWSASGAVWSPRLSKQSSSRPGSERKPGRKKRKLVKPVH